LLVLYAGQNADLPLRIGLSVGKQFGSAVARNRFKRRIRDIVRRRLGLLAPGWDIIFVARSSARTAPFGELESAVDGALRRAGILASTRGDPGEVGR
jgi:ribonuclease P protein component